METTPAQLTLTGLTGVPNIQSGDDLATVAIDGLGRIGHGLSPGDILVIAQKIVSKAEGRTVALGTVSPSERARELARETDKDPRLMELILSESAEVLRTRPGVVIVVHRLGFVLANAGIDASNVEPAADGERVLLLPRDPNRSAAEIRRRLNERTGADVGVIINDSLGRAWRNGTVGAALGASGVPGLLDLTGRADLYGRRLRVTEVGIADELAAAASLIMGQADEGRPIVLIRGWPAARPEGTARELIRPKELDLFRQEQT
ncbi:MAG: coenzyme F420-0:L-glutamate ligase [Alphaproteobacteria bacterium]|jgi:coenzyme F420-0:L-glutamate ligase/coenzyme F420-1:gamma-L-glutamate ligase|nr:coenzyme F420-0:L-glutamate ligase [Alphaproteobacteria bacterium]MDP6517717.1 coenzyme F420-0:L-glutamate ligase [Alphaproteobacteria bacterium]